MFRGRFTFTNEDPTPVAPTQQYQQQWQGGGQMQPYVGGAHLPTVFGQRQPMHHQAGDERYVRTVSFVETSTNDSSVSLQGAADKQAGNSKLLNLVAGGAAAALVFYVAGPVVVFGLKCLVALAAFFVGYGMFQGGLKPKGR